MPGNKNSGRRPKPTALKILEGNPGKRPLPEREPKFDASKGKPPSWLNVPARKVWRRLAPGLISNGLLTLQDEQAFACYCQACGHLAVLESGLKSRRASPDREEAARIRDWQRLIVTWAEQFGLSPSARSRVQSTAKTAGDEFDKFLKVKHG